MILSSASRLASASLVLALSGMASAQSFDLIKYLDTGAQVPGADPGVTFSRLDRDTPSMSDGVLAFEGRFSDPTSGATEGIFTVDAQGNAAKIVFRTDIAPSGAAYSSLEDEQIRDGFVSWQANGAPGLYMRAADGTGAVTVIADSTMDIPDRPGEKFAVFREHGRDGDWVLFLAENANDIRGAYLRNLATGALTVYAVEGSPSPFSGGATLQSEFGFSEPMVRNGQFTVRGRDTNGVNGLLTDFGSGIVGPINTTVASPGGLGKFISFDESSIDGDYVAFQSFTENGQNAGTYLYDHSTGQFTAIADASVPHPDGGFFDEFAGNPSVSSRDGIVTVTFKTDSDVWAWVSGKLVPVARAGDPLAGNVVSRADCNVPEGVDGTTTAAAVTFVDGTAALFVAELNGSFSTAGTGCPAALPMELSADCVPAQGQSTTVKCHNVPAGTIGVALALGIPPGQNLPLDPFGAPGCTVLIDIIFADEPMTLAGGGEATVSLAFPVTTELGATVDCQAIALVPGINPLGLVLSNRGRIVVGG